MYQVVNPPPPTPVLVLGREGLFRVQGSLPAQREGIAPKPCYSNVKFKQVLGDVTPVKGVN